jgi:TolB-like protein
MACLALVLTASCASYVSSQNLSRVPLPERARIAVLPFENLSGRDRAAEKITDYFQITLAGHDAFGVVEYATVYATMRRYRIRSSTLLQSDQIDSLAQSLNVQYLVTGAVLEYEESDDSFLTHIPRISFNCRVIDCATHNSIWVATANGSGDEGEIVFGIGAIRSLDHLARNMADEASRKIAELFGRD